jgi:ABC-2 type transport system ATP-binding protein
MTRTSVEEPLVRHAAGSETRPAAGREMQRAVRSASTSAAGIDARGLTKSFATQHGTVHAVRGIDLAVPAGQTVALLGPNGAGKSTTIDLLLGLNRPDAGSVTLFGASPTEFVARGGVAVMLQTGELIRDLSVREFIAMTAALYPAPLTVDEALEITGLEGIAEQRTQRLSGGERQRVRFAAALVSDAELIVLDEPTVGMDVESRRAFWTTIRAAAARGKTVLFATHYLEEADAYADRIVLMARGEVVADGPATEIKARVGQRTIRATLAHADLGGLVRLPGVTRVEGRGAAVVLWCADSDAAIRALLDRCPQARDIEIAGAGLEEAFIELTGGDGPVPAAAAPVPANDDFVTKEPK